VTTPIAPRRPAVPTRVATPGESEPVHDSQRFDEENPSNVVDPISAISNATTPGRGARPGRPPRTLRTITRPSPSLVNGEILDRRSKYTANASPFWFQACRPKRAIPPRVTTVYPATASANARGEAPAGYTSSSHTNPSNRRAAGHRPQARGYGRRGCSPIPRSRAIVSQGESVAHRLPKAACRKARPTQNQT
jgi:hypothetical protein